MSNSQTVPMIAPDGTPGDIPFERMMDAQKAGFKPAVVMKTKDGQSGYVPTDRMQDAAKSGMEVVPLQDQETQHPGFWHQVVSNLAQIRPSGFSPYLGMDMEAKSQAAADAGAADQQRKAEGRSTLYRAAVPIAESVGANVPAMEDASRRGDPTGVLAAATASAAPIVAAEGIRQGLSPLAKAAIDRLPSSTRAGAALGEIKSTVGNVPIDVSKVGNSALEMWTQGDRGGNLPPAVRKLVQRLAKPGSDPITYEEAKDFQSNISNLSTNEKMNLKPNTVRLLGQLNEDLKSSLADAADTQGKGAQFQSAMKEYHNAMKIRGYSDAAISSAWKVALGAIGARELGRILGLGER